MGRQKNDGRGRLGGRQKGTGNKPVEPVEVWLSGLVTRNRAQFEKDLQQLNPEQRAAIVASLICAAATTSTTVTPVELK